MDSHHPLRDAILLQARHDAEVRAPLRARQRIALDALVHAWESAGAGAMADPVADTLAWVPHSRAGAASRSS